MKKQHTYNRGQFLGTASCAAVGSTTFFSTLFNLQSMSAASVMNAVTSGDEDYKQQLRVNS